MAGLVLGLGVRQLLLQGRHQDVEHLVRVLLLHVDDPAVGAEAGEEVAGVVGVGHGRGGHVVQDLHYLHQSLGHRPQLPRPPVVDIAVLRVQPVVEGVTGCQGLQDAVDKAGVAGVDEPHHGAGPPPGGGEGGAQQDVETRHHRPTHRQSGQVAGQEL